MTRPFLLNSDSHSWKGIDTSRLICASSVPQIVATNRQSRRHHQWPNSARRCLLEYLASWARLVVLADQMRCGFEWKKGQVLYSAREVKVSLSIQTTTLCCNITAVPSLTQPSTLCGMVNRVSALWQMCDPAVWLISWRPFCATNIHLSDPCELLQRLCHYYSTINIIPVLLLLGVSQLVAGVFVMSRLEPCPIAQES